MVSRLTKARKVDKKKRKTEVSACWCQSYITDEHINFPKMPHHRGVVRCGAMPMSSPLAFEVFCLECQQDSEVRTGTARREVKPCRARGHTLTLCVPRQAFHRK